MVTDEDDWEEPTPEYADECTTCAHGITPAWDCDWCKEEHDE